MTQPLDKSDVNQHTSGYSSSPPLCGISLNSSEEKEQCDTLKNLSNSPKRVPQEETPEQFGTQIPFNCCKVSKEIVFVHDKDNKSVMPTNPRTARKLLKEGSAKVICRKPFTIQLNHNITHYKQSFDIGLDAGYRVAGFSARTNKKELFSSELELRTWDIVKKIAEKSMYRRTRRTRNTRFRKSRHLNRKYLKGWLPPSITHGINSHVKLVYFLGKYLPIFNSNTKIHIEMSKFDIQKINNPDIQGKEYCEGPQLGFQNVRMYVLYRDNYTCVNCKISCFGKNKTKHIEVHHIESRQTGGDRPDNMVCLCDDCHKKFHQGKIKIDFLKGKTKNKGNKAATFMLILKSRLTEKLKNLGFEIEETYGYITKYKRDQLGIEKSHVNDAFIIGGGDNNTVRCSTYQMKEKRRNNRCLQLNSKGRKRSIRRQRYNLQPDDIVKYNNKLWYVKGVHCYGRYVVITNEKETIDIKTDLIKTVKHNKGMYIR